MAEKVNKWMMWCDACGHGFYEMSPKGVAIKETGKLKFFKKRINKVLEPSPSNCPVCGKTDNVQVVKLVRFLRLEDGRVINA
jgi:hypothetical protein